MSGSIVSAPDRYRVTCPVESVAPPFPFMVMDGNQLVDVFRTRTSAEHHADALNAGRAIVEPHRPIGVRIQPRWCDRAGCPRSKCVQCQIEAQS